MGFTVTRQGGTKDVEFEEYARLLRQRGVDLARLPRTPEPGTGRRWLHFWQSQEEAQAFADELKKRTRDEAWEVVPVQTKPSEGPLGPVEITAGRQSDGWTFALHPLSRQMIQRLFPGSCHTSSVFIRTETGQNFQTPQGELEELAKQVVIILTGLPLDRIEETFGGYRVYDPVAKKELVASAPVQAPGGRPESSASGTPGSLTGTKPS
jgi:hypothetical protein